LLAASGRTAHTREKVIPVLFFIFLKQTHVGTSDYEDDRPRVEVSPMFFSGAVGLRPAHRT
jgi:hypothetical protein